jgi:hypothetical protein
MTVKKLSNKKNKHIHQSKPLGCFVPKYRLFAL